MVRELGAAAMAIFAGGFVITLTLMIVSQVKNVVATIDGVSVGNTATWTLAYNATIAILSAINLFITFLPLIVITIVGVLVLAYVGGLMGTGGKRGR